MTTDKLGDKEICKSCFYLQWHYPGRSFSVHKHLSCSPDPPANSPAGFVALTPAQLLWLPPVPGTVSRARSAAVWLSGVRMLWATIKPSGLSLVCDWIANPFLSRLKSLLCLLNSKSPLQSPILAAYEGIKRERRKMLPLQGKNLKINPKLIQLAGVQIPAVHLHKPPAPDGLIFPISWFCGCFCKKPKGSNLQKELLSPGS